MERYITMFSEKQIEDMVNLLIDLSPETKVYLGCDSVRYVHKSCRIFSHISHEANYDLKANRPKMRMMKEVQKVCELYTQLAPFIDEFNVEIHLDINTDPKHGSNCAASEAAGFVLGMTGIEPKLKPESWAASFGADGIAHGRGVSTSEVL